MVTFLELLSQNCFFILTSSRSHYELLGVSPAVDGITLRRTFRRLSKELHPDTTALPVEEAASKFQQVCEAYELLSDPIRRKDYDDSLAVLKAYKTAEMDELLQVRQNHPQKSRAIEVRRTLSGGELFSLLLLIGAFVISSILAITFAVSQGRELQVRPSWLIVASRADMAVSYNDMNAYSVFVSTIAPPSNFFDLNSTLAH